MTSVVTAIGAVLAAAAMAVGGAGAEGSGAESSGGAGAWSSGVAGAGGSGVAGAGGSGSVDARRSSEADVRTALVIDASLARDGRELVDPRLEDADAEVRLPRTSDEARTNVRYFTELGYRVVVAGPDATAAAEGSGASTEVAAGLPAALAGARR